MSNVLPQITERVNNMCLTFRVPCCDIFYNFRIKTMFGSSLPPVVCRRVMSFLRYLCLFAHSAAQHILCCVVFLFCFASSCVPCVVGFSGLSISDCPFGVLLTFILILTVDKPRDEIELLWSC
jgi:hypothetical protein